MSPSHLICGTYFKSLCTYRIGDYINARDFGFTFDKEPEIEGNYVFVKTELLGEFIQRFLGGEINLPDPFVLFTHNSDINITDDLASFVLDKLPSLGHWYAQNLCSINPKLSPLPIGIANPKWSHGNTQRFKNIIKEKGEKSKMVYINFNVKTNPAERSYCLGQLGSSVKTTYPNWASISDHDSFVNSTQDQYLRDIKKSYFIISPDGNGKDCHKTWESIYMGSIPIVTDSLFARRFKELGIPLLILPNWSCFKSLKLSPSLYNELWGDFQIKSLQLSSFML